MSDQTDYPNPPSDETQAEFEGEGFDPLPSNPLDPYKEFELAVCKRVTELLRPAGTPEDFIADFGPAFAEFMNLVLQKFADGQIKHGGDIRDRDMRRNKREELADFLNYELTESLQGRVMAIRI